MGLALYLSRVRSSDLLGSRLEPDFIWYPPANVAAGYRDEKQSEEYRNISGSKRSLARRGAPTSLDLRRPRRKASKPEFCDAAEDYEPQDSERNAAQA
jgi:hypothetical protein